MTSARDSLVRLVRLMVDEPDQVAVEEISGRESILFELEVAEEDLGKVIGRQGRTVRAIRSLLAARGSRDGERYEFEIIED